MSTVAALARHGAHEPGGGGAPFSKRPAQDPIRELAALLEAWLAAGRPADVFYPSGTLWADNAKKLRMVRVPIGTSLEFDVTTQTFAIPPNTRLYKTFFKKVIDRDGNDAYRKLETRLIVVRPDELLPDGTRITRALFGSYAWDEGETEAVLVQDPLRNGKPFRDRILTYVTDEQAAVRSSPRMATSIA